MFRLIFPILLATTQFLVAEVRVKLVAASKIPTKWEVAPYREAWVAQEYELLEAFGDLKAGAKIRILHHCLASGQELPCPGPKQIGRELQFRLEPAEKHAERMKNQFRRDNLDFDPDAVYFVAIGKAPAGESQDRFDYGSSLSDKIVDFAAHWHTLQIVAIGDSRTEAAIMPEILGDEAFNLATPSAGIITLTTIGRNYALPMPDIRVLVIGLSDRMFSANWDDGANESLHGSPAYKRDQTIGVAESMRELRELSPETIEKWREGRAFPYSKRGFLDYDDRQPSVKTFADPKTLPRLIELARQKPKFEFAPERLEMLSEFVAEALEQEVLVLAFLQPVYPGYREAGLTDDDGTTLEDHEALARQLQGLSSKERYHFVDSNKWAAKHFNASHFSDADHLSEAGARIFSKELRREIVEMIRRL